MAKPETTTTKKRGGQKAPPNETSAQKFVRLAKVRVPAALKAIARVQSLAGAGYEATDDQANKVALAIQTASENLSIAYSNRGKPVGQITFDI